MEKDSILALAVAKSVLLNSDSGVGSGKQKKKHQITSEAHPSEAEGMN